MTARTWCFTLHVDDNGADSADCIHPSEWNDLRYCVWQLEMCPDTGRTHYQGYAEFSRPKRLSALKKLSGMDSAHWESRKGTREQARDYCRKEDTRLDGPFEVGHWNAGGQGAKFDYQNLRDQIANGATLRDILDSNPEGFFKYHSSIQRAILLLSKPRDFKTHVHLYYGPPGVGKSREAMAQLPGAHWKQPSTKWWDTYDGTSDVVLDDFAGWLPYRDLLRLMDRYPVMVETKGSQVQFAPKKLAITTTVAPWNWYSEKVYFKWTEFARRVDLFHVWNDESQDFHELSATEFFNLFVNFTA